MGPQGVTLVDFADDLAIVAKGRTRKETTTYWSYAIRWKQKNRNLNWKKPEAVLIGRNKVAQLVHKAKPRNI